MPYTTAFIVAFLIVMTGIGVWHSRRIKTGEDFALAGRKLGAGVLIGTLVATWIGTGSIFGNAELTYMHGAVMFVLPIAGAAGILLLSFLAPRARGIPAGSVPQILRFRFGRGAQIIGAIALIGAYLIIVSYQYRAGAAVAQRLVPGLEEDTARWLTVAFATFVILYTVLAGMVSVAWTDLLNGILMAIGLTLALVWILFHSTPETQAVAIELEPEPADKLTAVTWIGLLLPAFLLVLGDANLHQRFMSAKSPATARRAAIGMFFGVLAMEFIVIALAFLSRHLLPEAPGNPANVVIEAATTLVPPIIGMLILAAVVSVIITTADSYLLGAATSVAVDFTSGLTTPWKQRLIVLGLGLVALAISFTSDRFFSVALYAYTLYGACLTPAVLCALLLPKTPRPAIVWSMAAGLITAVGWKVMLEMGNIAGLLDRFPNLQATLIDWRGSLPKSVTEMEAVLPALGVNLFVLIVLGVGLTPEKGGD